MRNTLSGAWNVCLDVFHTEGTKRVVKFVPLFTIHHLLLQHAISDVVYLPH